MNLERLVETLKDGILVDLEAAAVVEADIQKGVVSLLGYRPVVLVHEIGEEKMRVKFPDDRVLAGPGV